MSLLQLLASVPSASSGSDAFLFQSSSSSSFLPPIPSSSAVGTVPSPSSSSRSTIVARQINPAKQPMQVSLAIFSKVLPLAHCFLSLPHLQILVHRGADRQPHQPPAAAGHRLPAVQDPQVRLRLGPVRPRAAAGAAAQEAGLQPAAAEAVRRDRGARKVRNGGNGNMCYLPPYLKSWLRTNCAKADFSRNPNANMCKLRYAFLSHICTYVEGLHTKIFMLDILSLSGSSWR